LKPGNYLVCETQKSGWTQSQPDPSSSPVCGAPVTGNPSGGGYHLTLTSAGSFTSASFGNYTTASVSGHKFEDPNADGNLADGIGLANWTIDAYTDAATPVFVKSASTGANGAFSMDLQPGNYLLCEETKATYTQSEIGRAWC